jgi:hypothetical protein
MFDRLFALNCTSNVIVLFIVDQHLEAISFGEAINETLAVLVGSAWEVAGHADIKRTVAPIGHHINPAAHVANKSRRRWSGQDTERNNSKIVMPALGAGIHVFEVLRHQRRGWPGQARP